MTTEHLFMFKSAQVKDIGKLPYSSCFHDY